MKQITEEQIGDLAHEYVFNENGHKWSNNDNTAGDNFGSFIAGFKAAQEQLKPEWVPVSDRLPETSHRVDMIKVLGWDGFQVLRVDYYKYTDEDCGRFRVSCLKCFNHVTDSITHWMPLPAPPEQ